jgi:acyl-CoA hydrolase
MNTKLNASSLGAALAGAQEIYVSCCSAEIQGLPELLDQAGVGATVTGIVSPILNTRSYASAALNRRARTFFLNGEMRRDLAAGLVDFCPWSYSRILGWMRTRSRFDAVIVMVSPPDPSGRFSLGTQVDFLPDFVDCAGALIAVVNPQMPRTCGPFSLHRDQFAHVFDAELPLLEAATPPAEADPISVAVARQVAELIPDGATLQVGIGRISQAVTDALANHRGLRIHSGLIDEAILRLERAGALDPTSPITTGVAIGPRGLYEAIAENPRYCFRSVSHTHAEAVIAATPRFVAVNSALEIDLFGQVNSEAGAGRLVASPGGLPDFMSGARRSAGGLSIIALRAKPGRRGRGGIVARLDPPSLVSAARHDLDLVVTEHGVADLRDTSIDARAQALIAIADPNERRQIRSAALA